MTHATDQPAAPRRPLLWRAAFGLPILAAGIAALGTPLVAGPSAPFILGLLMVGAGAVQAVQAMLARRSQAAKARPADFLPAAVSVVAGVLLLVHPQLVFAGLAVLLGLSWVVDGVGKVVGAVRGKSPPTRPALAMPRWAEQRWAIADGMVNVAIGVAIAVQWPVSGLLSIAIAVGLRLLGVGWSVLFGRAGDANEPAPDAAPDAHPDEALRLPPHPELQRLRESLVAEEGTRQRVDRYWRLMFVVTFFAIHVGRMEAEWDLVGLLSPGIAVAGDLLLALGLAYLVIAPLLWAWRRVTRFLERRLWRRYLARVEAGERPGLLGAPLRWWLRGRMRVALDADRARGSPTAAIGWGLQVGLPLTAILIALNPAWGFSWYFNTENWGAYAWERWAEQRVDTWREHMAAAVREQYRGEPIADPNFYRVSPGGVDGAGDFSFIVIGDPGEGDASQHVLRDQYLRLGQDPDVKFLVVSSDVIYPSGAMKHYEPKFYLPFKGFGKPIYAVPGNHDWYDVLEAFTANFLEPRAAVAALRGRRQADYNLTTTTEGVIREMVDQAQRLREHYGVHAGLQRAPFFELQTDRFALIAVDTGILRTLDLHQQAWLRTALERSAGKFKLLLLGHPFYAGGRYHGDAAPDFAALHHLLREHAVDVVMAGDTHAFEHYRDVYPSAGGQRTMLHFVNGGGGAYLSIGTPLDWPEQPATNDWAFYPRADAVIAKLDAETPYWKQPLWQWVKRLKAWPSSPEAMASAFDYNSAPFFQSFMEVRVERSLNQVRLLLYGANGRLAWRDLQRSRQVAADAPADAVEFRLPLPPGDHRPTSTAEPNPRAPAETR